MKETTNKTFYEASITFDMGGDYAMSELSDITDIISKLESQLAIKVSNFEKQISSLA